MSSSVREHADSNSDRGISYAPDSCYLISLLSSWEGDLQVQGKPIIAAPFVPECDRDPRSQKAGGLADEQMRLSCLLADRDLEHPPSIRSWAAFLDMPSAQFSGRFYRKNGITPHAWLLERRIRHAQHLLRVTEVPVSELALQLGFANQSHFTEAFRLRVGMSPLRWRNRPKDFLSERSS